MTWKEVRVVITGASTGIGEALALRLAGQGASLVLAARNGPALEAVAARCRAAGGRAVAVPTDVSQVDACEALLQRAHTELGGLDVLVNNAGLLMNSRFEDTSFDVLQQLMNVNYFGAVYCTKFALPDLRASKGLLVAISSVTGKTGVPTRTGYAASKHAMQGFFDSLRIELLGSGVDVLVVSPGQIATDIRKKALGAAPSAADLEPGGLPLEACIDQLEQAMRQRRRDVMIPKVLEAGQWLKLVAPGVVDRLAARGVAEPHEKP